MLLPDDSDYNFFQEFTEAEQNKMKITTTSSKSTFEWEEDSIFS